MNAHHVLGAHATRLVARLLIVSAALGFQPLRWGEVAVARAEQTVTAGLLARGQDLFGDGKLAEALTLLEQVAHSEAPAPVRRDAWLYIGFCRINMDQVAEASEAFRAALTLDPSLRLDPRRYPPNLTDPFERVRSEIVADTAPSLITVNDVGAYVSPPEKLPGPMRQPWFKKWWVWALAGATVAAATLAVGFAAGRNTSNVVKITFKATLRSAIETVTLSEGQTGAVATGGLGSTVTATFQVRAQGGRPPYEVVINPQDGSQLTCSGLGENSLCERSVTYGFRLPGDFRSIAITASVQDRDGRKTNGVISVTFTR
ncbi:MAG: tetratricopeptide repeat protein [Candidatus Schekmanbacteria bacterium]|nr:tetratricopeptide repeat protein [Candidatus Schekmanbacteria bacterium]